MPGGAPPTVPAIRDAEVQPESHPRRVHLPRNVVVLSWVSFFQDAASEMLYPVLPLFLTGVLGAPVAVVGLIEGVAEATASVMKVVSGRLADLRRRRPLIAGGYALSSIAKPIIGLAQVWPFVLVGRFVDRAGKGIRTSPCDVLDRRRHAVASPWSRVPGFTAPWTRPVRSSGRLPALRCTRCSATTSGRCSSSCSSPPQSACSSIAFCARASATSSGARGVEGRRRAAPHALLEGRRLSRSFGVANFSDACC